MHATQTRVTLQEGAWGEKGKLETRARSAGGQQITVTILPTLKQPLFANSRRTTDQAKGKFQTTFNLR